MMPWQFIFKAAHLGLLATIEPIYNDDEPRTLTSESIQTGDHVHHQEDLIFECLKNIE